MIPLVNGDTSPSRPGPRLKSRDGLPYWRPARRFPMTSRTAMAGVAARVGLVAGSAGAGEVRGRLLVDKKPVSGASVEALALEMPLPAALREARRGDPPKPIATATTKPDGTFALAVAATSPSYQLNVSGGGAAPLVLERLFEPGGSDDLSDVTVGRAEVLAGRVVDARGGPGVGAIATLWVGAGDRLGRAGDSSVPVTTTTGADGSFRFTAATERGNRLRVEAPGFAMVELSGLRSGALRPLALALGP